MAEAPLNPVVGDFADEAGLIAALQAGENAAFERLVREHGGRMLAVARRMLRGENEAEEAVQDAFISAFKAIGKFEGGAKLSTWLHRITVNAALMRLRKTGRLRETSIEGMLPTFAENGHAGVASKSWQTNERAGTAGIESQEMRAIVMRSIDQLPEAYRVVLVMRDIDGLTTQQAAAMLETTEAAVKVRLHRARQALRELLDPHMREGGL